MKHKIRWLNEKSRKVLERGYLLEGQSPEERIEFIGNKAEEILKIDGFADKFIEYMAKGYYSLSSPIWSNFGLDRGLPISCFGSYIDDTLPSILDTHSEVGMMSKFGGGTSGYFGALRGRGAPIKDNGESSGAVHFMQLFQTLVDVVSQGAVRRGHFSPYLPIEHPDIEEFLKIGTEGNPIQDLTHGVSVTDKWMEEMIAGDKEKRELWAKLIKARVEVGYPYIFFKDTVNRGMADVYIDKEMTCYASNMCSEITLPSSIDESFVCDLSSMNILYYDEWKDTDAVEVLTYFLDAVMTDFIQKLEDMRDSDEREKQDAFKFMRKAHRFAKRHRALGIGAIGWHSYLQSKMLPFDDARSFNLNKEIFQFISEKALKASKEMAEKYGEPEVLQGYGRRNTTLMAIAPTTSSAFIIGQVSQSIEPIWSNNYVKDIAKLKGTHKNPILEKLLEEKGQNTKEVWKSILQYDGSVQHLDFLSDEEKSVFKTFSEIDQSVIIEQAADRQKYLDQSQSLNLMVTPDISTKEINKLYIDAWRKGVKTLYYQHSKSAAQEFSRKISCVGCEG